MVEGEVMVMVFPRAVSLSAGQEASKKQDALYTSCKADLATAEKEVQGLQV